MNQARTFLLIAWILIAYLVWDAWQQQFSRPRAEAQTAAQTVPDAGTPLAADGSVPEFQAGLGSVPAPSPGLLETTQPRRRITLKNDRLQLQIDTQGGSLISADLLGYRQQPDPASPPVRLLDTDARTFFVAQSGFTGDRAGLPNHLSSFEAEASEFVLADGAEVIEVPLTWTGEDGSRLVRTYRLTRGSYVVEVLDRFENAADSAVTLQPYRQLVRVQPPALPGSAFTNPAAYSFVGAAWFTPQGKFDKRKFSDFGSKTLDLVTTDGWVAMLQHYFFAAWLPNPGEEHRFSTGTEDGGRHRIRTLGPGIPVEAGGVGETSARLYVGPKLQGELEAIAPGLKLTLDYGIFTVISQPMAWLLGVLHDITGNWGWAIVLLVVIIKAVFFKLSEAQYRSFAKMRAVQPRIEALKERYGDDRQKFQTAMMELYKKEKINPMGGCLPILIQIPIFISLYWVLIEAVELRHAPWILWIENLTAPDPYFILPLVNLVTMWATQKLSPTPGMDPVQKRILQIMPIVFGVLFAFFPAGLVLYWATNGLLGLLQQWVIMRRHEKASAAKTA